MNKSYYFQHDYNAAQDIKILFLRQQLGIEGYGIYWFVLEQLAISGGLMPMKLIPVIAMQIQTPADKVYAVIKNYELFIITEDDSFFSARLMEQLEYRKFLSESGKNGAQLRWKNRGAIKEAISTPNAKERKERKENINIPFTTFWDLYKKKVGKPKSEKLWQSLTDNERVKAIEHIPKYIALNPDPRYRKNPEGYLSNKRFEDEQTATFNHTKLNVVV